MVSPLNNWSTSDQQKRARKPLPELSSAEDSSIIECLMVVVTVGGRGHGRMSVATSCEVGKAGGGGTIRRGKAWG